MRNKILKSITAFTLSVLMTVLCSTSAFAVLSPREEESYHTPGGLFINLTADAPELTELFEGYEIEKADLIKTVYLKPEYTVDATNQSSDDEAEYPVIGYIYHIWLVNETKEMLTEVVGKLLETPGVNSAVVNNYQSSPSLELPATSPDEPASPTPVPPADDYREPDWYPGVVIVALKHNSPDVQELLNGFEIDEVSFVTNLGHSNLYCVTFAEKTEAIVGKAIKQLATSPYVVSASPDYIGDWGELEGDIVYWTAQRGDTNSDGEVNIKDATTIQKWLVGIICVDLMNDIGDDYISSSTVGDFDYDGKITVKDATAIQKHIARIS